MKKILAIMLCIIAIFSLSATAFAVDSPTGKPVHSVVVIVTPGSKGSSTTVKTGEIVKVVANPDKGKFDGWAVYKKDGSKAVEGVDYKFVEGGSKITPATLEVYTDLIICANYDGKITDPITTQQKDDQSPQTGDFATIAMIVALLASAAVCFKAKKQLA